MLNTRTKLFYGLASWLLMPVALYYGLQVRARTPRQAPPSGPQSGVAGVAGKEAYHLLVIGDSSACGVGVENVADSLAPQIAGFINSKSNASASWSISGSNSATSGQIRDHVTPNLERKPYTHIVLSLGTNDMKNFHTVGRFKKAFGGLLYALHAKWPDATLIWSPLIDMKTVPGFPAPLSAILQMRRELINDMGVKLCNERYATVAPFLESSNPLGYSMDGFHASAAGYGYWAELLADTILALPEPAGHST